MFQRDSPAFGISLVTTSVSINGFLPIGYLPRQHFSALLSCYYYCQRQPKEVSAVLAAASPSAL
jgi:hypothetical protein